MMVAVLVLLSVLVFCAIDLIRLGRLREKKVAEDAATALPGGLTSIPLVQPLYRTPPGVFFETGHTWLFLEESGTAKLGIDDFARNVIGKLEGIEARSPGDRVAQGDVMLRVHHGDRALAFRAPVDGVVEELNTELLQRGELRGIEPYTASWVYRIRPRDPSFSRTLLVGAEATQWLRREVERLKVFLATVAPQNPVLGVTLQDGGMPTASLIACLNDLEWNKLREKFFD